MTVVAKLSRGGRKDLVAPAWSENAMAMSLWRRAEQPTAPQLRSLAYAPALISVEAGPEEPHSNQVEAMFCTQPGCGAPTAVDCAYVDRRGRSCGTAWCPSHRSVALGKVYCRRHAPIVIALDGAKHSNPDIDNRAPSLVDWVGHDVEPEMSGALDRLRREPGNGGLNLVSDPLHFAFHGVERHRAWQRSWKLCAHTGVAFEIQILVEEERSTDVVVRVNHNEVARFTPPWINARERDEEPDTDADRTTRARFRVAIVDAAVQALRSARSLC
jgi:hypothetical protein